MCSENAIEYLSFFCKKNHIKWHQILNNEGQSNGSNQPIAGNTGGINPITPHKTPRNPIILSPISTFFQWSLMGLKTKMKCSLPTWYSKIKGLNVEDKVL